MVWGCMSAGGIGQLTVGEGTMNSPKYCQILEHHMLPSISLCSFQSPTCSALDLQTGQCSMSHCQSQQGLDERAWSPAALLDCTISRHEYNRKYVAHHRDYSFQEKCKNSGGLLLTNGTKSRQNSANALLKTCQRESRHWCVHVAQHPNHVLFNSYSF